MSLASLHLYKDNNDPGPQFNIVMVSNILSKAGGRQKGQDTFLPWMWVGVQKEEERSDWDKPKKGDQC